MKFSTKNYHLRQSGWLMSLVLLSLLSGCKKWQEPAMVNVTTVAAGLSSPMGIETDAAGNIWVSAGETVNNDGSVWLIKPNGKKYQAIINLSAFVNKQSQQPQGTAHLLLHRGYLWVLSGQSLYRIDVSHFKPGDKPIDARKQHSEDVGAFVYASNFPDSHPYNLTLGPDDEIYITDAGANAILRRHGPNKYSVFAILPDFTNPTGGMPPTIQAVPTSILYNGQDFLVTTLTGFPFLPGLATIYKISRWGKVSVYQKGFTTLVDMAPGSMGNRIVLHYGDFGQMGFTPNSGSMIMTNGSSMVPLVEHLDLPVGIKQQSSSCWYITCTGDPAMPGSGSVKKVTYY